MSIALLAHPNYSIRAGLKSAFKLLKKTFKLQVLKKNRRNRIMKTSMALKKTETIIGEINKNLKKFTASQKSGHQSSHQMSKNILAIAAFVLICFSQAQAGTEDHDGNVLRLRTEYKNARHKLTELDFKLGSPWTCRYYDARPNSFYTAEIDSAFVFKKDSWGAITSTNPYEYPNASWKKFDLIDFNADSLSQTFGTAASWTNGRIVLYGRFYIRVDQEAKLLIEYIEQRCFTDRDYPAKCVYSDSPISETVRFEGASATSYLECKVIE